jgi:hypothetical protein
MSHVCPYCNVDCDEMYTAVTAAHEVAYAQGRAKKVAMVLCVDCGEPVAIEGGGLRRATFEELQQLLANDDYQRNRAVWIESERRRKLGAGAPGEAMWREYVRRGRFEFRSPEAEQKWKDIFLSGVSAGLAYVKEAMQDEDHVFIGKMNLLEAELDARESEAFESLADVLKRVVDALPRKSKRGDG